jgi:hypothetical protein
MPVIMLTDRFARTAKPQPGRRQTDYFDEATKGLALSASAGGGRTFFLHYTRRGDGRRVRLKLGAYGDISLSEARQKARDARAAVGSTRPPIVAPTRPRSGSATWSRATSPATRRHNGPGKRSPAGCARTWPKSSAISDSRSSTAAISPAASTK